MQAIICKGCFEDVEWENVNQIHQLQVTDQSQELELGKAVWVCRGSGYEDCCFLGCRTLAWGQQIPPEC